MALDFLALEDDSLLATYEAKPYNPDKMRERFIKGIETSFKRLNKTATPQSAKWFTEKNGVVLFKPMLDSRPVGIKGKTERTIASDKFPEYLELLKAAVEAGQLDDDLKAHSETTEATKAPKGEKKAPAGKKKLVDTTNIKRSIGRVDKLKWGEASFDDYAEYYGDRVTPELLAQAIDELKADDAAKAEKAAAKAAKAN